MLKTKEQRRNRLNSNKTSMKNYLAIYIYGAIIVFVGLFVLFSDRSSFLTLRTAVGVTLAIGGLFAFLAAMSNKTKQVQFAYHEMHAMVILAYGLSLLIFCKTIEQFDSFTVFLFVLYSVSEITFCSWLFNLRQQVVLKVIIIRTLLGLLVGIGTVIAMQNVDYTLLIYGILFVMIGINIMLYIPVMKRVNESLSSAGGGK